MISYCPICGKPVYFAERKRSLGKDYHPLCLKCYRCKRQLNPGQHAEYDEKPYCNRCYLQHFGQRGRQPATRASLGATGSSVAVEDQRST
ncbi:cysteine-rich protein 2 [Callorhinchus milii]|uniref:Cysteine-rich protein 1 n=1 Tax=Callorhinchus milii TaxID=7868 RepID=K4FUD8_CALMI|nr:cysteine-rich protein 2 [Callorhinchus milii]AFK11535.1 cysteine-rich protein 2-like protein [Callorhinchus milii]|eukprot:gi/632962284/ref/XP_007897221.1/ PREDICTED: cysteine-rich protein 2-like [Callorhinchus milii]